MNWPRNICPRELAASSLSSSRAEESRRSGLWIPSGWLPSVTHVADAKTCVLHPASHTHRQLTDRQLEEAGISPGMIRLSVGIENIDDILQDLEQALSQA